MALVPAPLREVGAYPTVFDTGQGLSPVAVEGLCEVQRRVVVRSDQPRPLAFIVLDAVALVAHNMGKPRPVRAEARECGGGEG